MGLGSPIVVILALAGAGQSQDQKPAPPTAVVEATVEVVQVDAVVTDSKGKYVTDLVASDFEIHEDGRKQTISNCTYVSPESTEPPAAVTPLVHLVQRESVRRTIAVVVDDLGLSFESTVWARNALHHFIDHQMQAGDLVAIVRASAGLGALQQFTSDRRMLHAAVDAIRFNLTGRGAVAAFSMPGLHGGGESGGMANFGQGAAAGAAAVAAAKARLENFAAARERDRQLHLTAGSLGAVRFVLGGLLRMPGRKAIVLVSQGFPMFDESGDSSGVFNAIRTLVDLANRASVVIYGFDPAGLKATGGIKCASEIQAGLCGLSADTGGFFVAGNNDLKGELARILEDQRGYYLIGYTPDAVSSRRGRAKEAYHRITVRVRRPRLQSPLSTRLLPRLRKG
jgi:VWFA-related protein